MAAGQQVTPQVNDWKTVTDWQDVKPGETPTDPKPAQAQPEGSEAGRAIGNFWDKTVNGLTGTAKFAYELAKTGVIGEATPETISTIHGILNSHAAEWQKAKDAFAKGQYVEAAGHTGAAALPVIGPMAGAIGEQAGGTDPKMDKFGNVIESGQAPDIGGAVGSAGALFATPKILSGAAKAIPRIPGAVTTAGKVGRAVADVASQTTGSQALNLAKAVPGVGTLARYGEDAAVSAKTANNLIGRIKTSMAQRDAPKFTYQDGPAQPRPTPSKPVPPQFTYQDGPAQPEAAQPPKPAPVETTPVSKPKPAAKRTVKAPAAQPEPVPQAATPQAQTAPVELPHPLPVRPPLTETPTNEFQTAARTIKANALAKFLYNDGNGIPHADAVRMDPQHWNMASLGSGVIKPSPATIQQALAKLKTLETSQPIARRMADEVGR